MRKAKSSSQSMRVGELVSQSIGLEFTVCLTMCTLITQSTLHAGVSCVTCHGRVDKMEEVYQAEDQSMTWCIDCHRNPAPHIRPADQVTNLGWSLDSEEEQLALGKKLVEENNINPQTNCAVCHR
jgi:hypothetical protein